MFNKSDPIRTVQVWVFNSNLTQSRPVQPDSRCCELLLTSATYKLTSSAPPELTDPRNWFWATRVTANVSWRPPEPLLMSVDVIRAVTDVIRFKLTSSAWSELPLYTIVAHRQSRAYFRPVWSLVRVLSEVLNPHWVSEILGKLHNFCAADSTSISLCLESLLDITAFSSVLGTL